MKFEIINGEDKEKMIYLVEGTATTLVAEKTSAFRIINLINDKGEIENTASIVIHNDGRIESIVEIKMPIPINQYIEFLKLINTMSHRIFNIKAHFK